ncbi:hypothetical protein D3C86_1439580 [compost metagenome]
MEDDRPIFVRSRWEANLVFYFEYLKRQGLIKNWYYEEQVFWFDGLRRGITNYKPDFKIVENDGSEYWIEVKGYFTRDDLVKMKRMAKYHKHVRIKLLCSDEGFAKIHEKHPTFKFEKYASYDLISEKKLLIKGWDQPFKTKDEIQKLIPLPMKRPKGKKKRDISC